MENSFVHAWKSLRNREYWMIYRWLCFLAVVWFGSLPTLSPPLPSVCPTGDTQEVWDRETSCWWKRGGEGVGEEPNHTTDYLITRFTLMMLIVYCLVGVFFTAPPLINKKDIGKILQKCIVYEARYHLSFIVSQPAYSQTSFTSHFLPCCPVYNTPPLPPPPPPLSPSHKDLSSGSLTFLYDL